MSTKDEGLCHLLLLTPHALQPLITLSYRLHQDASRMAATLIPLPRGTERRGPREVKNDGVLPRNLRKTLSPQSDRNTPEKDWLRELCSGAEVHAGRRDRA